MPNRPLARQDLDHVLLHTRSLLPALQGARLFITGGTGFFGHWIVESLLYAKDALDLDLQCTVLTRSAARFSQNSPHITAHPSIELLEGDIRSFAFPSAPHTHVLHIATDSGGQQNDRPPHALAEAILDGTRRVLQFARATGATRLLYTSSGAVYGRSSSTETHIPETSRSGPDQLLLQSSYDESKRMSEHLCVAYTEGTPVHAVIARPFAFIGPHLPLDQHFAIGNFLGAALHNRPIHIRGDGTPLRSWLYMADLTIHLLHLLLRGERNRAYNIGSEEAYSIAQAAHLTAATLRPGLQVRIDGTPNPAAPMNSYVPSTARLRTELGLEQTIDLPEALRRTANWHGFPASS